MAKKQGLFWALVVSFVFGVALAWPLWLKLVTIALSIAVLVQVCGKLLRAYRGGR